MPTREIHNQDHVQPKQHDPLSHAGVVQQMPVDHLQAQRTTTPLTVKAAADLPAPSVFSLNDLAKLADYSLLDTLNRDPDAKTDGVDHTPRQVFSGHYVTVNPTPIQDPVYITHSKTFFRELGFADSFAQSPEFMRMFSGDTSHVPKPMRTAGWACGYALSIYGTEYTQQCPFQTGNGYGDGRAVSVLEAVINGKRWEMQLKGGGRTPYCRGADGRAVLRSSVREFLAQEHMHALGVPTSRSLSLYVSKTEQVDRPWYSEGSRSNDPDMMTSNPVAISTRVAPSFIRVGQLELFARRARKNEYPTAMQELESLVLHLIDREYADVIDKNLSTPEKLLQLAIEFRERLTLLVANWVRVGYCQGNFNGDNCAAGGFTLDYGPFGFCDAFNPLFQPWTGGGRHFSFMNQPAAAERNFLMFCKSLQPLLASVQEQQQLKEIFEGFSGLMQERMQETWAAKLGLTSFNEALFNELERLMAHTPVDYSMFFRELSAVPDDIEHLQKSFYLRAKPNFDSLRSATLTDSNHSNFTSDSDPSTQFNKSKHESAANENDQQWADWFAQWRALIDGEIDPKTGQPKTREAISEQMKSVNPKYTLREIFLVPAYQQAALGNYAPVRELQDVMTQPYAEQTLAIQEKYYKLKPSELFHMGGLSHYSCSS
jgi:uncharacterized protein YdiU (UPF0061 family)